MLTSAFGPPCTLDSLYLAACVPLQVQFPLPRDPLPKSDDPLPEFEVESLAGFLDLLEELDDDELSELDDEELPESDDDSLPEFDDDPLPELDDDSLPELDDDPLPEFDDDPLLDPPPEDDDDSLPELDDDPASELEDELELEDALDEPSRLPNFDPYGPSSNAEQSGNSCANPTSTPGPTAPKNWLVTPLCAHKSICTSLP